MGKRFAGHGIPMGRNVARGALRINLFHFKEVAASLHHLARRWDGNSEPFWRILKQGT
jgi:hypothetical protein